jgi:hypothetical protein
MIASKNKVKWLIAPNICGSARAIRRVSLPGAEGCLVFPEKRKKNDRKQYDERVKYQEHQERR